MDISINGALEFYEPEKNSLHPSFVVIATAIVCAGNQV